MADEHAKYSPSRLARILKCPGSVNLIDALIGNSYIPAKQATSSYAEHGTMLHEYVHKISTLEKRGLKHHVATDTLNDLGPNDKGLVLDCLDYIDMQVKSLGQDKYGLWSEHKISLSSWGLPEVWGTADKVLANYTRLHVDVIDWKFGSGVQVYAKENPQFLAYAAGVVGWPSATKTITVHVFQPALDHVDTWTISIDELYAWVHGTLAVGIGKCMSDDPPIVPGLEQCRWCEAANYCDTRFTFVQEQAQKLFLVQSLLPKKATPEAIKEAIESAPLIEQAIKDLKLFAMNEIQHGRGIPGFKLVSGRANRKWKNEKETTKWLAENTEIEDMFISKLISPSQAEKLAKFLKKSEDYKKLWEKPEGKITLVSEKDPRPAIQATSNAVDVFSSYAEIPDKLE